MERIEISRIQNGYIIYQHGVGTVFYSTTEDVISVVNELLLKGK